VSGLTPAPSAPGKPEKLVKLDLARFGPLVKLLGLVANWVTVPKRQPAVSAEAVTRAA
jgi:hypothetical protein